MSLSAFFINAPCWESFTAYFAVGMGAGVHTARNRPSRAAAARDHRGTREAGVRHVWIGVVKLRCLETNILLRIAAVRNVHIDVQF